jgi:hypothetical protein
VELQESTLGGEPDENNMMKRNNCAAMKAYFVWRSNGASSFDFASIVADKGVVSTL